MSIKIAIIHVFFHKQPPVIYIKEPPYFRKGVQTVDKALLLQGFAIVGTAFLI